MSQLRETFIEELKDLYDAEHQLTKALPKLSKAAEHHELKDAFDSHLEETQGQIERLDQVFECFDETPKRKTCKGMQGLIKEGEEIIQDEEGDAALICAAQKAEHYEIAAYGSLVSWAKLLGEDEAAQILEEGLEEEKQADEKLTQIAESTINVEESEGEAEDSEKSQPSRRGGMSQKGRGRRQTSGKRGAYASR